MSPDEIIRRLEESGLTRAQVRDRLRRAGYNPSLADPYFDAMESGEISDSLGADATFLGALRGIGVTLRGDSQGMWDQRGLARDSFLGGDSLYRTDSLGYLVAEPDTIPRVFGRNVFRRVSTTFDPILTGPVGENYRLGPGDQVLLALTGDVELAYTLDVTREGFILIPDVGQVFVNGITLEQLQDRLYERLGQVYSGVRRSGDASTRFDVSLGRLRTNQVRVVGSVVRPGAYQVSSVATVLEALYLAGGPTDDGSFRRVLLRRAGLEPVELDLYPFLTSGAMEGDPRLEEGDVVFVPPVGGQVTLRGMVRLPAIYELRDGEGLPAVVRYAGGLLPDAATERAQVLRIVPPADRAGGVDRVLLDAPLADVLAGSAVFELGGGDVIDVFPVMDRLRRQVSIAGAVWRPGQYQLRPGSTVGSLVQRAGGLTEDALAADVLVSRLDLRTGSRSALGVDLTSDPSGPLLQEFDEVQVFQVDALLVPDSVAVYGLVRNPGRYPLSRGITAGDLVLLAGGFQEGAAPWSAEVVRLDVDEGSRQQLSTSRMVRLRDGLPYPDPEFLPTLPDTLEALPSEAAVPLQDRDEVFIRLLPGFVRSQRVSVEGEVVSPGPYQLNRRDERFSSLMARSGGLTNAAYSGGVRLIRDGVAVGIDYERALAEPGSSYDAVLAGGDRIVVPVLDNTVLVSGAVLFESRAVYRRGMSLDDFVAQAGGYAQNADRGRVSVEYANGSRAVVSKTLWLFRNTPDVEPGSRIFVPSKVETDGGFDWDSALTRILAVTSTVATVYIAVNR
ncbi:MAG: SLBB domain-containing protein [Gemmatimonadales bacterium]|nr:MAG: SLBB domain-containing protein [Gemmatimonadales bacterium]